MAEGLAHFHDAHHGCVNLVLPVLEDALSGAHLLLHLDTAGKRSVSIEAPAVDLTDEQLLCVPYCFFHLDLINLDAKQLVFEVVVEIEAVSVLHVLPPGVLVKDAGLSAGQGLQGSSEFSLLCAAFRQNAGYTTERPATTILIGDICLRCCPSYRCRWLCESPPC